MDKTKNVTSDKQLTHYKKINFRLFQTERVCRRQFQNCLNGRKLSKQVENTVGKGEIARYEQFLLFPQCFQKACFSGASKGVIVWEWVKRFPQLSWLQYRPEYCNVKLKLLLSLEKNQGLDNRFPCFH